MTATAAVSIPPVHDFTAVQPTKVGTSSTYKMNNNNNSSSSSVEEDIFSSFSNFKGGKTTMAPVPTVTVIEDVIGFDVSPSTKTRISTVNTSKEDIFDQLSHGNNTVSTAVPTTTAEVSNNIDDDIFSAFDKNFNASVKVVENPTVSAASNDKITRQQQEVKHVEKASAADNSKVSKAKHLPKSFDPFDDNADHPDPFDEEEEEEDGDNNTNNDDDDDNHNNNNDNDAKTQFRKMYNINNNDATAGTTKASRSKNANGFKPSVEYHDDDSVSSSNNNDHINSVDDDDDNLPMHGKILGRVSARTLFAQKEWQELYWVIERGVLYLFRSKSDYEVNGYHANAKKRIPITQHLRPLKIKAKDYSEIGILYNFMLEEIKDYGPSNLAKFASADKKFVQVLYDQLSKQIKLQRKSYGKTGVNRR